MDAKAYRWNEEKAWEWHKSLPWLCGFNFVPSTACNSTEWWQGETFDPGTIDRELGWAGDIGFNTARAFTQYIVWRHDPAGFKERFDRFLGIAAKHGITVMPVLFDDCAFGEPPRTNPYLGTQREPIPGMIAPSWTPSPGHSLVTDRSAWPNLKEYVTDMLGTFADDERVVVWDLYNEPGNVGMGDKSLPLVEAAFTWAREATPRQPLTVAVWNEELANLNEAQLALSDVISFHVYTDYAGMVDWIERYSTHNRPLLCTEWMARKRDSSFDTELPLFKSKKVGCYSWGLVNGRMQTHFPWDNKPGGTVDPETGWFHDIFHQDGTPYRPEEIEAIRRNTADLKS